MNMSALHTMALFCLFFTHITKGTRYKKHPVLLYKPEAAQSYYEQVQGVCRAIKNKLYTELVKTKEAYALYLDKEPIDVYFNQIKPNGALAIQIKTHYIAEKDQYQERYCINGITPLGTLPFIEIRKNPLPLEHFFIQKSFEFKDELSKLINQIIGLKKISLYNDDIYQDVYQCGKPFEKKVIKQEKLIFFRVAAKVWNRIKPEDREKID